MKLYLLLIIYGIFAIFIGAIIGLFGVWLYKILEKIRDKRNIKKLAEGKLKNTYPLDGKVLNVDTFLVPKSNDNDDTNIISLKGGIKKEDGPKQTEPKDTSTSTKGNKKTTNHSILKRR